MSKLLSPRDLAEAIGASESSLKRWADAGRLHVTRTEGGHRRITFVEAIRFIRASGASVIRPDLLGLPELAEHDAAGRDEVLYQLLVSGRAREARSLVIGAFLAGEPVASLADGPIRAAMTRIGALWQHDQRGIFVEHRATDACLQAIDALRTMVDPPDDAPVALGGALSDDPYVLPSMLAATVLAAEGLRAVNLGPQTPVASLRHAARELQPVLVWISCSTSLAAATVAELTRFARSLHPAQTALVIGGRLAGELTAARPAFAAGTMAELAAFARGRVALLSAASAG